MPAVQDNPRAASTTPIQQEKKTILLVDDHTSVRQMLAFLLPREGPYEVVGQVSSGLEALDKCRELRPAVVILDLVLPGLSGVEVLRRRQQEAPGSRMLVYSGSENIELVAEALRAKPDGFVHKEDCLDCFRDALRAVSNGNQYFTGMALAIQSGAGASAEAAAVLTQSEILVLQLLASGLSQKAAAERLHCSVRTVEYYRQTMSAKLGIQDLPNLTKYAIRHGLSTL